jgi:hypothetical protein
LGETLAALAAGFGVGTATAWRYVTETVRLLAACAPALEAAKKAGHAFVVIDGTLIAIDRVAKDRPSCSGKHHKHGMNLQVISAPDREIMWVSGPLPGAVHDLTAADLGHPARPGRRAHHAVRTTYRRGKMTACLATRFDLPAPGSPGAVRAELKHFFLPTRIRRLVDPAVQTVHGRVVLRPVSQAPGRNSRD